VSCLSLALCHALSERRASERLGAPLPCRLLVLQRGRDAEGDYVPFVSSLYAAMLGHTPLDSCQLGPFPSVFLRQAAHLTRACHDHLAADAAPPPPLLPQRLGNAPPPLEPILPLQAASSTFAARLLQRLQSSFLVPSFLRAGAAARTPGASALVGALFMPPAQPVDLTAACFCHGRRRTEAWVCAVCLAVWCEDMPVCGMCGTGPGAPDEPPTK
jgi:transcription initiation factor TFIIH subunit 3